jgi:hypothetical protein
MCVVHVQFTPARLALSYSGSWSVLLTPALRRSRSSSPGVLLLHGGRTQLDTPKREASIIRRQRARRRYHR